MRLEKRILSSAAAQTLLSALLSLYLRFVFMTSRKILFIDERAEAHMSGKEQTIFAFWHGRMALLPFFVPKSRAMSVLVSLHRDGAFIGNTVKYLGVNTVSGSSSKGGAKALETIKKLLKEGKNIGITPDGPRGPNQQASRGVATIAKQTGVAVVPSAYHATRHRRMNSWDRFMVPLPFSKIVLSIGAPITVSRDQDEEGARQAIETALNQATEYADQRHV